MDLKTKIQELEQKLQAMEDQGLERSVELVEHLQVFDRAVDQMLDLASETLAQFAVVPAAPSAGCPAGEPRSPSLPKVMEFTELAASGDPGEVSVLLVEDNMVNRKLAVLILERIGCRVDVAINGAEGVEKFKAGNYAAIFMDCQMPVMDGYEATRAIRKLEEGSSHIPIIAVTANAMKGDREKCLDCGMDDYIPKPLRPNDLQEAVTQWCKISV